MHPTRQAAEPDPEVPADPLPTVPGVEQMSATQTQTSSKDEAAIKEALARMPEAWESGDGGACASVLVMTPDT